MSHVIPVDVLTTVLADTVREELQRDAVRLMCESAAADAALARELAPLCLPAHERLVIAALLATPEKVQASDIEGLGGLHFAHRGRGLMFELLSVAWHKGPPLTRAGLELAMRAEWRAPLVSLDRLLSEIDYAPVVLGAPLRETVRELIAAAALSEYAAGVRRLLGRVRLECENHDDRHGPALHGPSLRAELRAMGEQLAPALRALEVEE